MGIREQVKTAVRDRLFSEEFEQMQQVLSLADTIYREGKFNLPTDELLRQLQESDAYSDLVNRLQLDEFHLFNQNAYAYDRNRAVHFARYMQTVDSNVQNANEMWTDFALGKGVTVESDEFPIIETTFDAAQNEELFAPENVHQLSFDALNEGELCFAYWFNPVTVSSTGVSVRSVPSDQIEPIWLDENDKTRAVWYKRNLKDGTAVYYPDWRATPAELEAKAPPERAKRTDAMSQIDSQNGRVMINGEEREQLVAVMSWGRMNRLANGRGLPRFRIAFEWAQVLTNFMGDRAAVSRKAAMYTENVTVSGGSRAVKDAVNRLQSSLVNASTVNSIYDKNPPPTAGSDWVQNEQVNREWQSRDTGAANAFQDGQMIAGQLGLTTGIALHWAGFPGAIPGGLATARELLKPWIAKIERFQLWLSGTFRTIAVVSVNIEENLVLSESPRITAKETDISVTLLSPILSDLDQLLNAMKTIDNSMKNGTLDPIMGSLSQEIILALVMAKIGVPDYEAQLQSLQDQEPVFDDEDETAVDDTDEFTDEDETTVDAETIELMTEITEHLQANRVSPDSFARFIVNTFSNGR